MQPAQPVDFVVVGEALIDLVPDGVGTTFDSPWQAQTAGGPLNTAVALARLGRRVDFAGPLSVDAFGRQMRAHLEANLVGCDRIPAGAGPTALATVSLDEAGKASYYFHSHRTATFDVAAERMPQLDAAEWLHIASLALVIEPAAGELLDWAQRSRGPLSIDVNVRSIVEPDPGAYWRRIEPWLDLAAVRQAVVKGSDEDFAYLAQGAGLSGAEELVARIAGAGVACVVTTLGPDGAGGCWDGGAVRVPGRRQQVVDTVAAGDTFMAGFLDAWTRVGAAEVPVTERVRTALERGVAASSVVVTRRGAQPPTTAEVDAVLSGDS